MSQPPHLCFFSTRCRYSQAFLEELSRSPYSREFKFICVDKQPGRPPVQLPPYVKAVPTLMIYGESAPRTDSQVMNWLSERRLREREAVAGGGGFAAAGAKPAAGPGDDGMLAFTDDMFANGGDEGFAYIAEVSMNQKQGEHVRIASNMASINDIHRSQVADIKPTYAMGLGPGPSAGGAAGGGGGGRQSEKAKALEDAYAAYQAARDRDVPKTMGYGPPPGPPAGGRR